MKCPKCGQNIFNNPDYCINCGHILKEKNHFTISIKTLALIIIIFIAVGSSVVIGIMYGGTEKELNNFLKEEEQLGGNQEEESLKVINEEEYEESNFNTIKNYFGHYVIAKIIPTNKTPNEISNDENNFLNWPIDFMEHQLKISLNKMEWEIVNNLKLYINNDTNSFKELFPSLDKITLAMIIEGTSNATAKPIKYNFIINNNTLYLYTYNTLFELKPT
ncbi:MAG: zinc ribbon domain-containing protein, partial [Bacilli bacterium]|nr:zinc ribbon domain-containing protein [Bacilli bacterium]